MKARLIDRENKHEDLQFTCRKISGLTEGLKSKVDTRILGILGILGMNF